LILNSEGPQFHQYQQNVQSPLICSHWTQKRGTTTYDVGNTDRGLEQAQPCGGVKPIYGILPLPSW